MIAALSSECSVEECIGSLLFLLLFSLQTQLCPSDSFNNGQVFTLGFVQQNWSPVVSPK